MRGFKSRVDVASWCGNRRAASRDAHTAEKLLSAAYPTMAGVRDLQDREGQATLPIVDIGKTAAPDGPMLAHLEVGQNGDPMSKIRGFRQALEGGFGDPIDVAVLKFCFWDI